MLQEHPEWLHTVRGVLLSEDLQNLPARLSELSESVSVLDKKIDSVAINLDQKIDGVAADLNQKIDGVAADLNRLEWKVDNYYCADYEGKVARHIPSIAGQHLGLISVRVLYGADSGLDPELDEALSRAAEQGDEAFGQVNSLLACDLIISGRRRGAQEREYAVFEASATVGNDDVNRAAERAAIMTAITGATARGVAIGATLGSTQVDLAQSNGVSAITYSE